MIADDPLTADTVSKMWNTFFHFFLDEESTAFLEAQCKKLLHESTSLGAWNQSGYSFLRFCNEHTRLVVRRHWQLYVDAENSSPERKRKVRDTVLSEMQEVRTRHDIVYSGSRSAGPYVLESMTSAPVVFSRFWATGTTFMDEKASSSATDVNPTFVYSLGDTTFSVHFGTTPIAPFHLAPTFLRSKPGSTVASDLIDCAKSQFSGWVTSFRTFLGKRPGMITIRLFCGEALRFCQALAEYRTAGSVAEDHTVAPWNTTPLVFDGPDYNPGNTSAPLTFNVIETSNLVDHVGLLNLLIAAAPILSETHSASLFTETLLCHGSDPTKSFNRQLCADLPTTSVLLGLLPSSYPSNFNSRSNAAEIILHGALGLGVPQYHERFVWRRPTTSDATIPTPNAPPLYLVAFEPLSLAKLLLRIYLCMFSSDDAVSGSAASLSIRELSMVPYIRETFVALVATVKRIVVVDWKVALDIFFALLEKTRSRFHYHQELCTQLHLAGIYTLGAMTRDVTRQGRFQGWRRVPPTVSVTLVVPRGNIQALLDMDRAEISNPMMQATITGRSILACFCSIKMAFGKVNNSGTGSDPRITFDVDPLGPAGSSPLVVSFSLPSRMLHVDDPEDMAIGLSFRLSPHTLHLASKFGVSLHVFKARLMDTSAVFVVPEEPHGVCYRLHNTPSPVGDSDGCRISAMTNSEGERISMLTARANILDDPTRAILSSGTLVTSRQVSPCAIEISVGPEKRRLVYPSPVIGALSKLRIARRSCYIEVGQDLFPSPDLAPHVGCRRLLFPSPENRAFISTYSRSRLLKRSKRPGISII